MKVPASAGYTRRHRQNLMCRLSDSAGTLGFRRGRLAPAAAKAAPIRLVRQSGRIGVCRAENPFVFREGWR